VTSRTNWENDMPTTILDGETIEQAKARRFADEAADIKQRDLVAEWNSIPESERKELTRAFSSGFNDAVKAQ
jgi:hypothetical protein